jgi:hypothetical protein
MSSTQPYNRAKGYHRVLFRKKTPLLHTELNEIQLRTEDRVRDILKYTFGANSYTQNNGFRVMPSSTANTVLIWPGELIIDGRVMILSEPVDLLITSGSIRDVWATFEPIEITPTDDSDIVYPDKPVTAYRETYEVEFVEVNTGSSPAVPTNGYIFKLAEIASIAPATIIQQSDITDFRPAFSNNYVFKGCDIVFSGLNNPDITIGVGEVIIADVRDAVVAQTITFPLTADTTYYYFFTFNSGTSEAVPTNNTTGYPVDEPVVKLLSFTTDGTGNIKSTSASISDDRVFSPVPAIQQLLSSSGGASSGSIVGGNIITGTALFGSTTGTDIDFNVFDPVGAVYPEFDPSDPTSYSVDVEILSNDPNDAGQVGQIFVDQSAVARGFRIYNTGSNNWTEFRWSVNIDRTS